MLDDSASDPATRIGRLCVCRSVQARLADWLKLENVESPQETEWSMTWKDKLEIGLKDDAPYRRDNLPDFQKVKGGSATQAGDATRSPEEPGAREDCPSERSDRGPDQTLDQAIDASHLDPATHAAKQTRTEKAPLATALRRARVLNRRCRG